MQEIHINVTNVNISGKKRSITIREDIQSSLIKM
nr:MAG TPA: hypothetical protein [Caudoviricetes sp.]